MTAKELHKELLNKLDDWAVYDCFYAQTMNALRAVVVLHNPNHPFSIPSDLKCSGCDGLDFVDYPCATIRAIETALNNV